MKTPTPRQSQRILVVDDNPAIHEDFKKIFAGTTGNELLEDAAAALFGDPAKKSATPAFAIDSAFQGEEALARVIAARGEGQPYAMAFVDVRMPPGWDGVETITHLWKADPQLQVVICTAYSDYSWDEMIEKLGISDQLVILKKPFDTVEVLQLAHALTARWHLEQQVRGHIDGLERLVTQRTAELDRSDAHFRVITENMEDLITMVDTRGVPTYHSPSFEKVLGLSPEELSRTPAAVHIHPDDQTKVILATREAFESGKSQLLEYRMQHRDGSWRALEAYVNPVRDNVGNIESLVVVGRDITERRQMEVQLRHAQKMESIGQLAAGIAHEINTPTQYIGDNTHFVQDGFRDLTEVFSTQARLLEAVKAGAVNPQLIEEVETASSTADIDYLVVQIPKAIEQSLLGVQRVAKIVGAMKDFSHPGTDEKTEIDLNRAIESTVTVASNEWKYVANLVTDFDPELPPIPCLPGEFNQVILNLVVNASHAISDVVDGGNLGKGQITLSTRVDGDWAEVRVGDSGTGIPEEIRSKIFDPFFTTKGVGKGTGQGLAIAHSVIVDKHGGTIQIESEVGKGSTFIIRLPLRTATPREESRVNQKKRILFVDDEPLVLEGIQRTMRPMRLEWAVDFAGSGAQAKEFLAQATYDVVVTDMMMPGMDGATLLAFVKEHAPKTIRLILTGHAEKHLSMKCIGIAHQYLSKPCDAAALKSIVSRATDPGFVIRNDQVIALVSQLENLPSMPAMYSRMLRLLSDPATSMDEVGELISGDMAMTAKILQLVNSSFFAIARRVTRPAEAASYLGMETIKSLVLATNVFGQFEARLPSGFSIEQAAEHSQHVAAVARAISRAENAPRQIVDDALVAGLLHDVGELVLASNLPEKYERIPRGLGSGTLEAERAVFGTSHPEVGGYLLGLWGLPTTVIDAISLHHEPQWSSHEGFSALTAVHVADCLITDQSSSGVNLEYLGRLGLAERLPIWTQLVNELSTETSTSTKSP